MKKVVIILAGILLVSAVSLIASAQNPQPPNRAVYCENQRKACFQGYTRTNADGVKMVTAEGSKVCWAAYRECMAKK